MFEMGADFNPWTASAEEALRATAAHDQPGPDPLAQHAAAQKVLAMREQCLAIGGGRQVLEAMAECARAQIAAPAWLGAEFARRLTLVTDAYLPSLDESFGRFWAPGTRLADVRKQREEMRVVHASIWSAVQEDEAIAINRELFERAAADLDMNSSTVSRRYYAAIAVLGLPNALEVRKLLRSSA